MKQKMWRIEDIRDFKSKTFYDDEEDAKEAICVFKENFGDDMPFLRCYLVQSISEEELKEQKIQSKKNKDYDKEFSNYILKLKNRYGNDLKFSQIKNKDFDLLCKLYIQFKYKIPMNIIENYLKGKNENE